MSDKYVLIATGPVNSTTPLIEDQYVVSCDVEAYNGRGDAEFSRDLAKAKRFDSMLDALEYWHTQSKIRPTRPDGKPNRPLTAFSVEVKRIEE